MIPFLLFAVCGGFYGILYYLNSKAPVPEGALNKLEECHACGVTSCELHPSSLNMEEN